MQTYKTGPTTNRLTLRALTVDDAEDVYAFNSHPEVMRYTHEPRMESVQAAREAISSYPDFETVGFGRWGCVLKETQRVIGFCGLKYLAELDSVDLGYRLLPQYWGRGLATEAAIASIQFGFEVLELSRIIGLVLPANLASIRVLEKVGMQYDGPIEYDGIQARQYSVSR